MFYMAISCHAMGQPAPPATLGQPAPPATPGLAALPATPAREPISKFALSLNPLGFVQFGPVINAEFGIRDDLVVNTHVRLAMLGLLSYVIKYHSDGLDNFRGTAAGGGVIKFFGENVHKPYVGGMLEYHRTTSLYAESEAWEWTQVDQAIVIIFNGGYRFRLNGDFFINTGAFLGAAPGIYNWEYTDNSYGDSDNNPRSGTDVTPFGMIEVTLGIEF